MTTPTLEDALATSTEAEIRDAALDALATAGCSMVGIPTTSADRGLIEIHSRALAREQEIRSYIARAGSKQLIMAIADEAARDAWLDYLAAGWFGLPRLPATKATHRFRLVASAAAGPYTIAPRTLLAQTEDGIQFRNTGRLTSDLTASPGSITLTLGGTRDDLEWEAVLAGIEGNIAPDASLTLVTTLAGVSISNPEIGSTGSSLLASGADRETSESLSLRCDARWDRTAVAQLPGALVEWIVESFEADGLTSTITKWRVDDTNPNGPGSTDLYLANASGPATAAELSRVDAYQQARRGVGSGPLRTLAAAALSVPFTAQLYSLGAATSSQIQTDAAASIAVLESLIAIGGIVYGDDITKALRSLSSLYHVTHSLEGVTTVAGVNEVIEFAPTFTVIG